jgi:hypothetical protein
MGSPFCVGAAQVRGAGIERQDARIVLTGR